MDVEMDVEMDMVESMVVVVVAAVLVGAVSSLVYSSLSFIKKDDDEDSPLITAVSLDRLRDVILDSG
jgi:hypothetical protein